jgi:FAD/FMN-containing dehydrogenase
LPAILTILERCRNRFPAISAFEYFPRNGLEKVLQHHHIRDPFDEPFPFYVLIEIEEISESLREQVEEFFCEMLEDETLAWVVMSQNTKQLEELLSLRELLPETLSSLHTLHKNDISVPISQIPEFLARFETLLLSEYPNFEIVTFGHIGDGNLHVNVIKPDSLSESDFFTHAKTADAHLFELINEFKGSISAEHGVGLKKKAFLHYSRTAAEIKLMQGIKKIFDPKGILNPGKIFESSAE